MIYRKITSLIYGLFNKKQNGIHLSGNIIPESQFGKNTIIFGGTGTGKTKAIILPVLDHFIGRGLPGIVVDVKNNLTKDVYAMAERHGRIDDIIEIGNLETSCSINIINDISEEVLFKIISDTLKGGLGGNYWEEEAMAMFNPILKIYYLCIEKNLIVPQNLFHLSFILTDPQELNTLYEKFCINKELYMEDYELIVAQISASEFHPLKENVSSDSDTYSQQQQWTIGQIKRVFSPFMDKKVVEKLSNINNKEFSLDFKKMFWGEGTEDLNYKNKIIVLRFTENFSPKAASLINDIIFRSYKSSVIELGGEYNQSFRLIDEYQTVINVEQDAYWLDKCREFNSYQILATQSFDGLLGADGNINQINTIVDNCQNKFSLFSNNLNTMDYFYKISPISEPINLNILEVDGSTRGCWNIYYNTAKKIYLNFNYYTKLASFKTSFVPSKKTNVSFLEIKTGIAIFPENQMEKDNSIPNQESTGLDIYNKYLHKLAGYNSVTEELQKPDGEVSDNYKEKYTSVFNSLKQTNKLPTPLNHITINSTKRINQEKECITEQTIITIVRPRSSSNTTFLDTLRPILKKLKSTNIPKLNKEKIEYIDYDDLFAYSNKYRTLEKSTKNGIKVLQINKVESEANYIRIYIFITGGYYDQVVSNEGYPIQKIYDFVNENKKDIFVAGLGHEDFIHPINLLFDYSYATPSAAGGNFLEDIEKGKSQSKIQVELEDDRDYLIFRSEKKKKDFFEKKLIIYKAKDYIENFLYEIVNNVDLDTSKLVQSEEPYLIKEIFNNLNLEKSFLTKKEEREMELNKIEIQIIKGECQIQEKAEESNILDGNNKKKKEEYGFYNKKAKELEFFCNKNKDAENRLHSIKSQQKAAIIKKEEIKEEYSKKKVEITKIKQSIKYLKTSTSPPDILLYNQDKKEKKQLKKNLLKGKEEAVKLKKELKILQNKMEEFNNAESYHIPQEERTGYEYFEYGSENPYEDPYESDNEDVYGGEESNILEE